MYVSGVIEMKRNGIAFEPLFFVLKLVQYCSIFFPDDSFLWFCGHDEIRQAHFRNLLASIVKILAYYDTKI